MRRQAGSRKQAGWDVEWGWRRDRRAYQARHRAPLPRTHHQYQCRAARGWSHRHSRDAAGSPGSEGPRPRRCPDPSDRAWSARQSCAPLRVGLACELECVRVGEVCVRRRDCENDRVGVACVARAHQSDLILDVNRLITDAHLGHSGKVEQRQIEDRRRIYLQVDDLWRNAAWLRTFTRSVSRLISAQIYSKSKNFWPRG